MQLADFLGTGTSFCAAHLPVSQSLVGTMLLGRLEQVGWFRVQRGFRACTPLSRGPTGVHLLTTRIIAQKLGLKVEAWKKFAASLACSHRSRAEALTIDWALSRRCDTSSGVINYCIAQGLHDARSCSCLLRRRHQESGVHLRDPKASANGNFWRSSSSWRLNATSDDPP
jgi:hypothetical protein